MPCLPVLPPFAVATMISKSPRPTKVSWPTAESGDQSGDSPPFRGLVRGPPVVFLNPDRSASSDDPTKGTPLPERKLNMLKPASLALALALGWMCGAAVLANDADSKMDVSGTWNLEVELGGNTGNPVFTFKQKGETLTGKYKGQFGEAEVKGTVKGKKIEFSFKIGDMGKAVYTGTIEKGAMKGDVKYGDALSGTWTGKKDKEKKKEN
jgi:hypothetical protein